MLAQLRFFLRLNLKIIKGFWKIKAIIPVFLYSEKIKGLTPVFWIFENKGYNPCLFFNSDKIKGIWTFYEILKN